MTINKGWKYAIVKIGEADGSDVCELVELYPLGPSGEYNTFCRARMCSLEDLHMATRDIERDGTNLWFWENGEFTYDAEESWWDWKRNKQRDGLVGGQHIVTIEQAEGTDDCFVPIPDELLEELDWEEGDEILIEETEICEPWGEHRGFTLANLSKPEGHLSKNTKDELYKEGVYKIAERLHMHANGTGDISPDDEKKYRAYLQWRLDTWETTGNEFDAYMKCLIETALGGEV